MQRVIMGKGIYDKAKVLTSLRINIIFCWNEGYCRLEDDSLIVMRLVACRSHADHMQIPELGVKISEFTSEKKPPMNNKYSVFHSYVI